MLSQEFSGILKTPKAKHQRLKAKTRKAKVCRPEFLKHLSKFGQQFVFTSIAVHYKLATPVKREFFEICRRSTFQNIPMIEIEFSTKL